MLRLEDVDEEYDEGGRMMQGIQGAGVGQSWVSRQNNRSSHNFS